MKKIGIISDTHGHFPQKVHEVFAGCDHIIHGGDIGAPSVLIDLETIAPVTAVLGNCDHDDFGPAVTTAALKEFDGVRILVVHRPSDLRAVLAGANPKVLAPGNPLPHIAIHGHTHTLKNEIAGAVLTLCPGAPNNPRNGTPPSVLLLTVNKGKVISVETIEL
ncbi:MAG: metallophosphatase family protein [Coriobacteriia bacterium]|nr:metallophosphatase family protein [Coriobacteriia bacterium]